MDEDRCNVTNIAEKGRSDSHLSETHPANRSSLACQNQMQTVALKKPSLLIGSKIKLQQWATSRYKSSEKLDLTNTNQKSDAEVIVHCSSKRKRVVDSMSDNKIPCNVSSGFTEVKLKETSLRNDYIDDDKCQIGWTKKMKSPIASSSVEVARNMTGQATDSSQANQGTLSLSNQNEEATGHHFLAQVISA